MDFVKTPIPGELPFGIYLKGDKPTYRALRNAFNAAQAAWRSLSETPESLEDRELGAANATAWAALSEQCQACLTDTSKDLEILTWYLASLVHGSQPLPRLAQALTLITDLVEESIDALQPAPPPEKLKGDSDDARAAEIAELRLRPFLQLVGEVEGTGLLHGPITNLPLVGDATYGKFVIADKDGALEPLRADVSAAIGGEAEALTQKVEALQEIVTQFERLDAKLKSYASQHGQTPPPIGYGRRLATDVLAATERLVEGMGFAWPGAEVAAEEAPDEVTGEAATAQSRQGTGGGFNPNANVANRDDALTAIAKLATFFRTAEPHSPICLLLDRAVRWGNLSAGDLYREILTEGSVGMSQMALMTGLESQGYADGFSRRGAGAPGTIEHPTLSDYAAAIPTPSEPFEVVQSAPAPTPAPTPPAAPKPAPNPAPVATEPEPTEPVPDEDEPDDPPEIDSDLPVSDFEW